MKIDPGLLAFDIDGVVADTMTLFVDIAKKYYKIDHIKYDDITCYELTQCLTDIDEDIINNILTRITDGDYSIPLKPVAGAVRVLNKLGLCQSRVCFVTARPYPGPVPEWIHTTFLLAPSQTDIVTTGSYKDKNSALLKRNIKFFVEDRLETCFCLQSAGITPILFKQPWNRENHPFKEVNSWREIESIIKF
jgi:5'(3')-deoxyribonucleotidase